jgi:hypothetical protein
MLNLSLSKNFRVVKTCGSDKHCNKIAVTSGNNGEKAMPMSFDSVKSIRCTGKDILVEISVICA